MGVMPPHRADWAFADRMRFELMSLDGYRFRKPTQSATLPPIHTHTPCHISCGFIIVSQYVKDLMLFLQIYIVLQ